MLKDETLNILLAGRDTTACTLTFSVFALAEHPAVLERLRREVLDVVGPTHRPTYEHIREMKYMRAFINEVLRLYPPVYVIVLSVRVSSVYGSDRVYVQAAKLAVSIVTLVWYVVARLTVCARKGARSRP